MTGGEDTYLSKNRNRVFMNGRVYEAIAVIY